MQWQVEPREGALSVFRQSGRHAGKEFTHWLTDAEFNSAHVHVLINCSEVKPYLDSFVVAEQVAEGNTSARIHSEFPHWFRNQVFNQALTPTVQELRHLSNWPMRCVKEWHTYFINGYKFHTHEWSKGKKTSNCGSTTALRLQTE
ncbi:uncharacterized protein LOC128194922 [Vigna angularis]|uniref:uncharacterized protein LOC128194922 n=1 Tax=Phaseolus angularis TaxID=3914 RepID=UPI0022B5AFE5|nr:uncharacterized protein LOC128194922 [Vigna angularis]